MRVVFACLFSSLVGSCLTMRAVRCLQQLMRLVDNEKIVDPMTLKTAIEEDLNYYINEHETDEFVENEMLYADYEDLIAAEVRTPAGLGHGHVVHWS